MLYWPLEPTGAPGILSSELGGLGGHSVTHGEGGGRILLEEKDNQLPSPPTGRRTARAPLLRAPGFPPTHC